MNQDAGASRKTGLFSPVFRFGTQEPSQNALWRGFPKRYKNAPKTARTAYEFARIDSDCVQ